MSCQPPDLRKYSELYKALGVSKTCLKVVSETQLELVHAPASGLQLPSAGQLPPLHGQLSPTLALAAGAVPSGRAPAKRSTACVSMQLAALAKHSVVLCCMRGCPEQQGRAEHM